MNTTPPQNINAETSVIGGCLMSADAMDECRSILAPEDYYRPQHEVIWSAMLTVAESNEPVDVLTVTDHLTSIGSIERAGGAAHLHEIVQSVVVSGNTEYHAQIVSSVAARRRLVSYANRLAQQASSSEGDFDSLIGDATAELDGIADSRNSI